MIEWMFAFLSTYSVAAIPYSGFTLLDWFSRRPISKKFSMGEKTRVKEVKSASRKI
jgi:hypothetical protein